MAALQKGKMTRTFLIFVIILYAAIALQLEA